MLLKSNDSDDNTELSFRPIADNFEAINEFKKTSKIDIIITVGLYIFMILVILLNME